MSAEASLLVKQAITFFDTDRPAARRCLNDALLVLGVKPNEADPVAPGYYSYRWRPGGLPRWQVQRALAYIDGNLGSKLTAVAIADTLFLSVSHFSRAFKRVMGCPPMTYVTLMRLERAKAMMTSTAERLSNIALACGFSDQSHFTKLFHRRVGLSPSVWRRINSGHLPGA
jgi:AraC family transcriptional regulator